MICPTKSDSTRAKYGTFRIADSQMGTIRAGANAIGKTRNADRVVIFFKSTILPEVISPTINPPTISKIPRPPIKRLLNILASAKGRTKKGK